MRDERMKDVAYESGIHSQLYYPRLFMPRLRNLAVQTVETVTEEKAFPHCA